MTTDPHGRGEPAGSETQDALTASCVSVLTGWVAPSSEQEQLRVDYLEHLRTREQGWSRACTGAHLTASSLVCAPDGQVLLTLHAKLGRWLQTGGHLDSTDTSLEAAALREAEEESGLGRLTLDRTPLLLSRHEVPCGRVRPTLHLDVQYLVLSPDARTPTISDESSDLRWFAPDGMPAVDDSVRALVAAAGRRLGT